MNDYNSILERYFTYFQDYESDLIHPACHNRTKLLMENHTIYLHYTLQHPSSYFC